MVIRLVAYGNLLFSELCQPFLIDLNSAGDGERWYLVLKNTAHVMSSRVIDSMTEDGFKVSQRSRKNQAYSFP